MGGETSGWTDAQELCSTYSRVQYIHYLVSLHSERLAPWWIKNSKSKSLAWWSHSYGRCEFRFFFIYIFFSVPTLFSLKYILCNVCTLYCTYKWPCTPGWNHSRRRTLQLSWVVCNWMYRFLRDSVAFCCTFPLSVRSCCHDHHQTSSTTHCTYLTCTSPADFNAWLHLPPPPSPRLTSPFYQSHPTLKSLLFMKKKPA